MTDLLLWTVGAYCATLCGLWTLAEFVPAVWPVALAACRPVVPFLKLVGLATAFLG